VKACWTCDSGCDEINIIYTTSCVKTCAQRSEMWKYLECQVGGEHLNVKMQLEWKYDTLQLLFYFPLSSLSLSLSGVWTGTGVKFQFSAYLVLYNFESLFYSWKCIKLHFITKYSIEKKILFGKYSGCNCKHMSIHFRVHP